MGFIYFFKNIFTIKELKRRLFITFLFVTVYRLGAHIPIPGINLIEVNRYISDQVSLKSNIIGLLNSFTGGSFKRASIFALGIMPYISASIIVQLLGMLVPFFQKLQKEGESGRNKLNQYTRFITIFISIFQSFGYLTMISSQILPYKIPAYNLYFTNPNELNFIIPAIFVLVSGTVFCMWIGDKITENGIGNGISIIIMVGILSDFPTAIINALHLDSSGGIFFIGKLLLLVVIISFCISIICGVRKIPIQYVKRDNSSPMLGTIRSYIPLKINSSGVMPIIFAQALMFLPSTLYNYLTRETIFRTLLSKFIDPFNLYYNLLFSFLIIIFAYFYTAISIPVNQIADDLKRSGGVIPGLKPGRHTALYIKNILSKITLPGAILLVIIAVMPSLVKFLGVPSSLAMFYGGTSMLIMVGVILETSQNISTYLLNNKYDKLLSSGRLYKKNKL